MKGQQQFTALFLCLEPNIWSNTLSRLFIFLMLMVMSLGLEVAAADSEIIHIERSLYRDVYVYDLGNQLCTGFMDRNDQSCIYKDAKDYLVWEQGRCNAAHPKLFSMRQC